MAMVAQTSHLRGELGKIRRALLGCLRADLKVLGVLELSVMN